MNELVFGIIGHRKLLYVNRLENLIQDALKALAVEYTFTFIVSPLADGSDRIVAYAKKLKNPFYI